MTPDRKQAVYTGCLGLFGSALFIGLGLFSGWTILNLICLLIGLYLLFASLIMIVVYGRT